MPGKLDQTGFLMPSFSLHDAQEQPRGMPYHRIQRAALPSAAQPCSRSAWICSGMSSLNTIRRLTHATTWSLHTQQLKPEEDTDSCGKKFRGLIASSQCGTVLEAYHLDQKHQLCNCPYVPLLCQGQPCQRAGMSGMLGTHVLRRLKRWSSSSSGSSVPFAACSMTEATCRSTVM